MGGIFAPRAVYGIPPFSLLLVILYFCLSVCTSFCRSGLEGNVIFFAVSLDRRGIYLPPPPFIYSIHFFVLRSLAFRYLFRKNMILSAAIQVRLVIYFILMFLTCKQLFYEIFLFLGLKHFIIFLGETWFSQLLFKIDK